MSKLRGNNMIECIELEEMRKCAEKEYDELMNIINTVNPKSKPSKGDCERIINLIYKISVKHTFSKFADYKEVERW